MNIFDTNSENKIRDRMHQILEKSPEPGELLYCPPPVVAQKRRQRFICRLVVACIATIAIITTGVLALNGTITFIPGYASFNDNEEKITHSITNNMIIEQGNHGNRIMYGYIKGSEVYLKILFYDPVIGLTGNQAISNESGESIFPYVRQEYSIYYNGKVCTPIHKGYSNSSADLTYKLPRTLKNEKMVIELYGDDKKIADIEMMPVTKSSTFVDERPHATIDDITLIADVKREGKIVDIYISAALPNTVDYYDLVNEQLNGYSESDVYLIDKAGNKYTHRGKKFYEDPVDDTKEYESDALLMFYHHYRFDLSELKEDEYTLVIPSITYLNKLNEENKYIEVTGPFEININI